MSEKFSRKRSASTGARVWLFVPVVVFGLVGLGAAPESIAQEQALQPRLVGKELLDALRQGGLVVLMRHMATDSYVPPEGTHDGIDCATQRNLSDAGRESAKAVGKAITALGISVGPIYSSPYCRCVETGMLAFQGVEQEPELAVFDALPPKEKDARAKRIREMLNIAPPDSNNTVLITHTGTLLYTFGLQTRPEGIAHVFRPMEFGQAVYLGRVLPEDWSTWAAAAAASAAPGY